MKQKQKKVICEGFVFCVGEMGGNCPHMKPHIPVRYGAAPGIPTMSCMENACHYAGGLYNAVCVEVDSD